MPSEYHERGFGSTERGFESYLESLNLSLDDLRDKKILDVGSGAGRFSAEAKAEGVENIISLDPELGLQELKERAKELGATKLVGAKAEAMPFKDESFDLILNNFSLPMWSESPEALDQAFREELRALRPGGEIRIAPVMVFGGEVTGYFTPESEDYDKFVEVWDKLMEKWKNDPTLEVRVIQNPETMQNTLVIKKILKK